MNVNKKLDRFRQWGKEKMGGEVRTNTTDDFKALEAEMDLRHQGMEKLHSSMGIYIKHLSKRTEGEGKERPTPLGLLGSSMTRHGEIFEDGNKFGECLKSFGEANERLGRFQDSFAASASTSWLDALERSLAQMKDYQNARKRLDQRRLAYDTSMTKMQKAKREDFRTEEELRAQKAKYDESNEDVYRRMQDIVEAENDNAAELYNFLEAELNYHDRCREVLLQLKREWPLDAQATTSRRPPPSRGGLERFPSASVVSAADDELVPPPVPGRISRGASNASSQASSQGYEQGARKAMPDRSRTEPWPTERPPLPRLPTEPANLRQVQLRPVSSKGASSVFDDDVVSSSPASYFSEDRRSGTPATSFGTPSSISQRHAWPTVEMTPLTRPKTAGPDERAKKAPPPPPPSRSTKPPPPPPPMKRGYLNATTVS